MGADVWAVASAAVGDAVGAVGVDDVGAVGVTLSGQTWSNVTSPLAACVVGCSAGACVVGRAVGALVVGY